MTQELTPTLLDADFVDAPQPQVNEKPQQEQKPDANEPAPQKFRKEIDLGDGSGKQVFEADTQEALIEKLVEAQANATKKIRELNHELKLGKPREPQKRVEKKAIKPVELSADEQFLIAQNLSTAPVQAFERLFESVTGLKPEDFRRRVETVDALEQALQEQQAAEAFVLDHLEDYHPTAQNFQTIQAYLNKENLAFTRENLEIAFRELSGSGLLTKPSTIPPQESEEKPRIETPQTPAPKKPVSSGLSDRSSASAPASAATLDVAEIEKLPLEQARERILAAMRSAQSQGSQ